jgi:peptide/nickel transport system substrate-binding protein
MSKAYLLVICLLSASFVGCIEDAEELEKKVIDDSEDVPLGSEDCVQITGQYLTNESAMDFLGTTYNESKGICIVSFHLVDIDEDKKLFVNEDRTRYVLHHQISGTSDDFTMVLLNRTYEIVERDLVIQGSIGSNGNITTKLVEPDGSIKGTILWVSCKDDCFENAFENLCIVHGDDLTYECELVIDSDGDGVTDDSDAFPNDANETEDIDNDGVGDNQERNTLTSMSTGQPVTLDPAVAYEIASTSILMNVYETLIFYDRERTDKLIPVLAEEVPSTQNGGISADGLTYTFKIRQDVTFHDGSTMDADDVVFSINRLLKMDIASGPAWMYAELLSQTDSDYDGIVDSITKVDQYTVQFNLKEVAPRFLAIMAYNAASIISEDWVSEQGCEVPTYNQECNEISDKAMGTGPYMLTKWIKDELIELNYYPDYWRGWSPTERQNQELPEGHIKTVRLIIEESESKRADALKEGSTDFAYIVPNYRDEVLTYDGMQYEGNLPSLSMGFIGFNHDISNYEDTAPSSDFFTDEDIRKGFCYSFNYDSYIDDVLDGWGKQPTGPIPDGLLGYNPNGPQYEYDLPMAENHFKEAGVWDTGFTITAYYNTGNDVRMNALLILEDALESMNPNFNVEVQGLEWPTYLDKLRANELPLFFLGWAPDYADPHNYAHPFLHSDGHFANYLSFEYDDIDELVMNASKESDSSIRANMYEDLADLEHDNALYIWTSQSSGYHFQRDWVQGWYHNPMHSTLYYTLSKDGFYTGDGQHVSSLPMWNLEEAETGMLYNSNDYYNDGLVTLVEFFHSECGHCQNQAPTLQDIYEDYGSQINMFAIGGYVLSGNTDNQNDIAAFKSEYSLEYPHLYDSSGELMDEYGFNSYPSMVLIKNDVIVFSHSGRLTYDQITTELEKHL